MRRTQNIVPMGEGRAKPLSIAIPREMVQRIDRIREELGLTRSKVVRRLLRFSLNDYEAPKRKKQHLARGL